MSRFFRKCGAHVFHEIAVCLRKTAEGDFYGLPIDQQSNFIILDESRLRRCVRHVLNSALVGLSGIDCSSRIPLVTYGSAFRLRVDRGIGENHRLREAAATPSQQETIHAAQNFIPAGWPGEFRTSSCSLSGTSGVLNADEINAARPLASSQAWTYAMS